MQSPQFAAAANQEISSINNTYTNARYAPTGNQTVGKPFPLFRQPAYYFTDWQSSGLTESTWKKEFNLPTNTNYFRNAVSGDAIGLGDNQLKAWTMRSQTLANNGDTLACANNADCSPWPGTTCNANYENWPNAHGNQSGSYCSYTKYPELEGGVYTRKLTNEGGIGRACKTDRDCGTGYNCNNETDFVGKNVQQTGFCAKTYSCPDGSTHFLGTPYNSGIPKVPPKDQNRGGRGYASKEECSNSAMAQQDCVQADNGAFYATYPGYCPVPANLRQTPQGYGNIRQSSPMQVATGFSIPAYATNSSSDMGSKGQVKPLAAFNVQASRADGSNEALQYSLAVNPRPPNM